MAKTIENRKVWVGYARKSSDTEDRQVLSVESQVDEIKKIAKGMGLEPATLEIRTETRTAKKPGRPVWDALLADIGKSKVSGIIAWHANRLSRNSVDTGAMIYLMDQGKLAEVVTSSQVFRENPNDKMMLNFFCMVAKYENDNKGIDAQRGLRKKADMGYLPSGAKPGYMNDPHAEKGNKKLFSDPIRFPIIKEAWRLMLTGLHTPPHILRIINDQYGYRTPQRKRIGGHPMMRSQIYKMFRDPFYYGPFEYPEGSGNWYNGKHEKMITESEYWKVQELLGRKGMPRPQIHSFTFSGMMQCGFCGALVTAEFKTKRQKNGTVHHYIYYHCTHRKLNTNCTQGVVEEDNLVTQICGKLDEVEVPEELHAFAVKWSASENKKEAGNDDDLRANLAKELATCEATIDGLIDMRARTRSARMTSNGVTKTPRKRKRESRAL